MQIGTVTIKINPTTETQPCVYGCGNDGCWHPEFEEYVCTEHAKPPRRVAPREVWDLR